MLVQAMFYDDPKIYRAAGLLIWCNGASVS
jgi:hypothetical protein